MSEKSGSVVAVVSCPSYRQDDVDRAIDLALDLLGGLKQFIRPGESALVKPNLLRAAHPDEAITTHPSIVRAVASRLKALAGSVVIAESPSGLYNRLALERVYQRCQMDRAASEAGVPLNFDTRSRQVPNPEGKLIKMFDLIEPACTAQAIVSLPKLKTHNYTILTCAVKNLFGLIPGTTKVTYHSRMPDAEHFADMLLDLYSLRKPRLSVVDAVVAMEGDGPSAGKKKQTGLIMASADGIALDAVACAVMGFRAGSVPTLAAAMRRLMPGAGLDNVTAAGLTLDAITGNPFKPPTSAGMADRIPGFVKRAVVRSIVVQPVVTRLVCTGCGTCQTSCPAGAIKVVDRVAAIDREKCFRCYCCHEVCPQKAIGLQRSFLSRLLRR